MINKIVRTSSLLLLALISIQSCTNPAEKQIDTALAEAMGKGFQLMEYNCFACHSPNPAGESKIGPSMAAIKSSYLAASTTQEQFTKDFISFLSKPDKANSKMPDAVKKYGLMPKMNVTDEQITQIATYLYASEIEKPDWFASQYSKEKIKYPVSTANLSYEQLGLQYAMQTKSVLGKNLLQAINTKGTENALEFCSSKAYPLTDSMAIALHASIKRVSDKNRNPQNAASPDELVYIQKGKELLLQGQPISPLVQEMNGKMVAYYPIMTDQMCLQCHGKPEAQILPATLEKIHTFYPSDQATGYDLNQLRGMWVIEMNKQKD